MLPAVVQPRHQLRRPNAEAHSLRQDHNLLIQNPHLDYLAKHVHLRRQKLPLQKHFHRREMKTKQMPVKNSDTTSQEKTTKMCACRMVMLVRVSV